MFKDYYAILALPPSASAEQVRASFKHLALQCHPDKTLQKDATLHERDGGQPVPDFTDVQEAYEVLGDVARRYLYDLNYGELVAARAEAVAQERVRAQREQQARLEQQQREREAAERELRERERERAVLAARAAATAAAAADVPDAFNMTRAAAAPPHSEGSGGGQSKPRPPVARPHPPPRKAAPTPEPTPKGGSGTSSPVGADPPAASPSPPPPAPPSAETAAAAAQGRGSKLSSSDHIGDRDSHGKTHPAKRRSKTERVGSAGSSQRAATWSQPYSSQVPQRQRPTPPPARGSNSHGNRSGRRTGPLHGMRLPPLNGGSPVSVSLDLTGMSASTQRSERSCGGRPVNKTTIGGAEGGHDDKDEPGEAYYHRRAVEKTLKVFFSDYGFGDHSDQWQ